MNDRIDLIEYLLIPNGVEIGFELEKQRVDKFLADFKKLTPSASRLRWSQLVASKKIRDEGMFLQISIKSKNQLPLFPHSTGPFASEAREFEEEARLVKAEIDGIPSYVQWALGPAVRPEDLRGNNTETIKLRTTRNLMLRARSRSVLYGLSTPELSVSRSFFSDGMEAEVTAVVNSISKYQCKLGHLKVVGELPEFAVGFQVPTRATMWYEGYQRNPAKADALFKEMAIGTSSTRFRVNFIWDSVTGLIHHLDLLAII